MAVAAGYRTAEDTRGRFLRLGDAAEVVRTIDPVDSRWDRRIKLAGSGGSWLERG